MIEYFLAEPITGPEADIMAMAELLTAALARAEVDESQLPRIGADWGRYLSGRPGQDAITRLPGVLACFGYRVQVDGETVSLKRSLCPLVSPDAPLNICGLIEGVVAGTLGAAASDLVITQREHHPDARSCRLGLSAPR
ncbi:MAG TPA: hypothetical protein VGG07_06545 [Solirubrobacteraceae bacterium]